MTTSRDYVAEIIAADNGSLQPGTFVDTMRIYMWDTNLRNGS